MNQQPQQPQLPQQQQPQQVHPQQPVAPAPQATTTMSVSDMRQQIIANALHLYPDVVNQHVKRFPNVPIRAEDVFDVSVRTATEKAQDGTSTSSSYARLTHAHDTIPAARMTLMGGPTGITKERALQALLDRTCAALSHLWDAEKYRKDLSRREKVPFTGTEGTLLTYVKGALKSWGASKRAKEIDREAAMTFRPDELYERDA